MANYTYGARRGRSKWAGGMQPPANPYTGTPGGAFAAVGGGYGIRPPSTLPSQGGEAPLIVKKSGMSATNNNPMGMLGQMGVKQGHMMANQFQNPMAGGQSQKPMMGGQKPLPSGGQGLPSSLNQLMSAFGQPLPAGYGQYQAGGYGQSDYVARPDPGHGLNATGQTAPKPVRNIVPGQPGDWSSASNNVPAESWGGVNPRSREGQLRQQNAQRAAAGQAAGLPRGQLPVNSQFPQRPGVGVANRSGQTMRGSRSLGTGQTLIGGGLHGGTGSSLSNQLNTLAYQGQLQDRPQYHGAPPGRPNPGGGSAAPGQPGGASGANVGAAFQQAYNSAREANLERYNDILEGRTDLANRLENRQSANTQGLMGGYADLGAGQQGQLDNLLRNYNEQRGRVLGGATERRNDVYQGYNAANQAQQGLHSAGRDLLLGGYDDRANRNLDQRRQDRAAIEGGYSNRLAQGMQGLRGLGEEGRSSINTLYDERNKQDRGQVEQDLISRGLGNTTVRGSMLSGTTNRLNRNRDLALNQHDANVRDQLFRAYAGLSGDALGARERQSGEYNAADERLTGQSLSALERLNQTREGTNMDFLKSGLASLQNANQGILSADMGLTGPGLSALERGQGQGLNLGQAGLNALERAQQQQLNNTSNAAEQLYQFQERRTDAYPDISQLLGLANQYGASGAGLLGLLGGGQFPNMNPYTNGMLAQPTQYIPSGVNTGQGNNQGNNLGDLAGLIRSIVEMMGGGKGGGGGAPQPNAPPPAPVPGLGGAPLAPGEQAPPFQPQPNVLDQLISNPDPDLVTGPGRPPLDVGELLEKGFDPVFQPDGTIFWQPPIGDQEGMILGLPGAPFPAPIQDKPAGVLQNPQGGPVPINPIGDVEGMMLGLMGASVPPGNKSNAGVPLLDFNEVKAMNSAPIGPKGNQIANTYNKIVDQVKKATGIPNDGKHPRRKEFQAELIRRIKEEYDTRRKQGASEEDLKVLRFLMSQEVPVESLPGFYGAGR